MIKKVAIVQDKVEHKLEKLGSNCLYEKSKMKHREDGASSQVHAN